MNKVRRLSEARLYAIIDLSYVPADRAVIVLEKLIQGGVDVVQLRGKNCTVDELSSVAQELLEKTVAANIPLIVNDHAEIAVRVRVEGVHVGQDDDSVARIRAAVKRPIIVGKSTHNIAQALAAEHEGADYIGFGPLFHTPTKPESVPIGLRAIREVHDKISIPIFCIGGIHIDNLQSVIDAGAKRVVIVSALLRARSIVDYARCATDMLA